MPRRLSRPERLRMTDPLTPAALIITQLALLLFSAFFSAAEAALSTANRTRLRQRVEKENHRGARRALILLEAAEFRLYGPVRIVRTLTQSAFAVLCLPLFAQVLDHANGHYILSILAASLLLLFFSESLPRNIGKKHADSLAPWLGYPLSASLSVFAPLHRLTLWFCHFLDQSHSICASPSTALTHPAGKEHGGVCSEALSFMAPQANRTPDNLSELESATVEDIMTPRSAIKVLDIDEDWDDVLAQLQTNHHSRLPVCHESLDHLLGVLPLRRVVSQSLRGELNKTSLLGQLLPPYYIPAGTPALVQMVFFQQNRQRFGFVVDEYGEILGLLTRGDITEEIASQLSAVLPKHSLVLSWDAEDCAVVDGGQPLRAINRMLNLNFPTDGPKTLNGLILEYFQDIPENGVSFKISGVQIEILQTQDRSVRTAKLFRP